MPLTSRSPPKLLAIPIARSFSTWIHSDDEDRWTIIGMAGTISVILRVSVSEVDDSEVIRIISARKANAAQRDLYSKQRNA